MRPHHAMMLLHNNDPEALLDAFAAYRAPDVTKWIGRRDAYGRVAARRAGGRAAARTTGATMSDAGDAADDERARRRGDDRR